MISSAFMQHQGDGYYPCVKDVLISPVSGSKEGATQPFPHVNLETLWCEIQLRLANLTAYARLEPVAFVLVSYLSQDASMPSPGTRSGEGGLV